ncbi:hypothetical protein STEG23_010601 [Scotinomys teguina]
MATFGYPGFFVSPYEVENCSFQVYEELCWYFDRDCIKSIDSFWNVPCIPTLSKAFIMKGCWILSNAFSASNEMIMCCYISNFISDFINLDALFAFCMWSILEKVPWGAEKKFPSGRSVYWLESSSSAFCKAGFVDRFLGHFVLWPFGFGVFLDCRIYFLYCFMWAFSAMNFPLSTAFIVSHRFGFDLVHRSIGWNLPSSAFCKAGFVDRYCSNLVLSWNVLFTPSMVGPFHGVPDFLDILFYDLFGFGIFLD